MVYRGADVPSYWEVSFEERGRDVRAREELAAKVVDRPKDTPYGRRDGR